MQPCDLVTLRLTVCLGTLYHAEACALVHGVRRQEDKTAALLWLLQEVIPEGSPTLIFTATRHHVEFLHTLLTREGLRSACVYGQMDQVGTALRWHSAIIAVCTV